MQEKKNLGTAIYLVLLFGPFGFIYFGWKSFWVAIASLLFTALIFGFLTYPQLLGVLFIFEYVLLIGVWRHYKKVNFVELNDVPKVDYGQEYEYKQCPFCGEQILLVAKKCKYCGEFLDSNYVNVFKQKANYLTPTRRQDHFSLCKRCKL